MYLKNIFVFDSVISSLLNPFLMLEAEEGSVQMTSVKKKNGIVKKPTFRIFFSYLACYFAQLFDICFLRTLKRLGR